MEEVEENVGDIEAGAEEVVKTISTKTQKQGSAEQARCGPGESSGQSRVISVYKDKLVQLRAAPKRKGVKAPSCSACLPGVRGACMAAVLDGQPGPPS